MPPKKHVSSHTHNSAKLGKRYVITTGHSFTPKAPSTAEAAGAPPACCTRDMCCLLCGTHAAQHQLAPSLWRPCTRTSHCTTSPHGIAQLAKGHVITRHWTDHANPTKPGTATQVVARNPQSPAGHCALNTHAGLCHRSGITYQW